MLEEDKTIKIVDPNNDKTKLIDHVTIEMSGLPDYNGPAKMLIKLGASSSSSASYPITQPDLYLYEKHPKGHPNIDKEAVEIKAVDPNKKFYLVCD